MVKSSRYPNTQNFLEMDLSDKIDKLERHVLDRQLHIARALGKHFKEDIDNDPLSQSAFAIISICFSYFEMIEQFATGQSSHGKSEQFFKRGFASVFGNSVDPVDAARLYSMLRCGMYHSAMPTDRCGLSRCLQSTVDYVNGVVVINPALLVDALIEHFNQFCAKLRDECQSDLRNAFETMWDSIVANANPKKSTDIQTTPAPWD